AAVAAQLRDRVTRPDLLVVAALLHDLGKGQRSTDGDHAQPSGALVDTITARMGFGDEDRATLTWLAEHHLLLSEVATRRDLNDRALIQQVAERVGSSDRLAVLHALTEADAIATGPAGWGPWKADLIVQLVTRVRQALDGRPLDAGTIESFPTDEQ